MYRDRVQEALKAAAAPTLEDMRAERRTLPPRLAKVITYVVNHLFDWNLTAGLVWEKTEIGDHSLSKAFRAATGRTLWSYIELRRLEVADRMVRLAPDVKIGQISLAVGYQHHGTFLAAYKKWLGERPSDARRRPGPTEIDYLEYRRGLRQELDSEAAWQFHEKWLQLYPSVEQRLRERYRASATVPRVEIDGARYERWSAEGLWQELKGLPVEEQRRRLREVRFHSTALFDLLRRASREEGRRDRQRGIELAKLALESLEGSDGIFGDRIHDLRALGWAWLGNAQVLSLDFSMADDAFEQAKMELSLRAVNEPGILAEIYSLMGTFRMYQQRYPEARQLVERSLALSHENQDEHRQAKALIQRAEIMDYSGDLDAAMVSLEDALLLLDERLDPFLAYAAVGNLVNLQARTLHRQSAEQNLEKAKNLLQRLDHPLGRSEVDYLDGYIRQSSGEFDAAEPHLRKARDGFTLAGERIWLVFVSIDLAITYCELGIWEEAVVAIAQIRPLLQSLPLSSESLKALTLLSQALKAEQLTATALRELRDQLHRDPRVHLLQ